MGLCVIMVHKFILSVFVNHQYSMQLTKQVFGKCLYLVNRIESLICFKLKVNSHYQNEVWLQHLLIKV